MADIFTAEKRSEVMSRIRGKDTGPERMVRSMLHRAGYRFRLNVAELPGKPDIVLPKYGAIVMVHGCFWHQHKGCRDGRIPKNQRKFWKKKFERNIANDQRNIRKLRRLGWRVIVVWECQLKNPEKVLARLEKFISA